MNNPAVPLWLLVALFIVWSAAKVLLFGALARRIGPKYLTLLDSSTSARPRCSSTRSRWSPGRSQKRSGHLCTLPKGHDGEHRCDCGKSWPVGA